MADNYSGYTDPDTYSEDDAYSIVPTTLYVNNQIEEVNQKTIIATDRINLVVKQDNTIDAESIVTAINLLPDSIQIAAKNITLIGAVTFLSDISGDLGDITAGTLNGVTFNSTYTPSDGSTNHASMILDNDSLYFYESNVDQPVGTHSNYYRETWYKASEVSIWDVNTGVTNEHTLLNINGLTFYGQNEYAFGLQRDLFANAGDVKLYCSQGVLTITGASGITLANDVTVNTILNAATLKMGGNLVATQSWVTGNNYATQSWVSGQGYATQSWVNGNGFYKSGDSPSFNSVSLTSCSFGNGFTYSNGYITANSGNTVIAANTITTDTYNFGYNSILQYSAGFLTAPAGSLSISQNTVKANTITQLSNADYKKNIQDWDYNATDMIIKTPIRQYQYKIELDSEFPHCGIIVQEAPVWAVSVDGDGIEPYAMASMAWKAIQELNDRLTKLEVA